MGFEPTVPRCGTPVFETGPFNHSGTPPGRGSINPGLWVIGCRPQRDRRIDHPKCTKTPPFLEESFEDFGGFSAQDVGPIVALRDLVQDVRVDGGRQLLVSVVRRSVLDHRPRELRLLEDLRAILRHQVTDIATRRPGDGLRRGRDQIDPKPPLAGRKDSGVVRPPLALEGRGEVLEGRVDGLRRRKNPESSPGRSNSSTLNPATIKDGPTRTG